MHEHITATRPLSDELYKKQDYFSGFFFAAINASLPPQEGLYVSLLLNKYNQALKEYRNDNLVTGDNYIAEAAAFEQPDQEIANRILLTFANNILAYREYKLKDYEKAKQLTAASIDTDSYLETQGFPILHFHKVQAIHNIARIHLRNHQNRGLLISLDLLRFLSVNHSSPLYYNDHTLLKEKNRISPELTLNLFIQIFSETISYLSAYKKKEIHLYYFYLLRELFLKNEVEREYKILAGWLDIVIRVHTKGLSPNTHLITQYLEEHADKLKNLSGYLIDLTALSK